jgi:hypothetical protein
MAPSTTSNLTKVRFDLDPSDWHGTPGERLWAEYVGDTPNGRALRLDNSPFFTRDVSFRDIVAATKTEYGDYTFERILVRGGHSTYMLLVPPGSKRFVAFWTRLERLGCTYESATITISLGERTLYSVDVPPTTDIYAVYEVLEEGERSEVWMFQEGHVGHRLKHAGKQSG